MDAQHKLVLGHNFLYPPNMLAQVKKSIPLTAEGYIPYHVFDTNFATVHPTILECGASAISLSLGRPFGFVTPYGISLRHTQQTDEVIIEGDNSGLWLATLRTPTRLRRWEKRLFQDGLKFYESCAAKRLPQPGRQDS